MCCLYVHMRGTTGLHPSERRRKVYGRRCAQCGARVGARDRVAAHVRVWALGCIYRGATLRTCCRACNHPRNPYPRFWGIKCRLRRLVIVRVRDTKNAPKDAKMITRLRDIDPRAGTLTFPRDTPLMHNFTLTDTRGVEIRNTNHEAHEQFVVHRFLQPTDTVLELGGGIGTNSVQINLTLRGAAKARHHVFEPQEELVHLIRRNGAAHRCRFTVVHGVLSKTQGMRVPCYTPDRNKWIFVRACADAEGPRVPSVSDPPVLPTAIVADCEGCLLQVLRDFPQLLERIRMVYFENDGGREVLLGIRQLLEQRGMCQVVNTNHHKLFLLDSSPPSLTPRPIAHRTRRASRQRRRDAAGDP